MQISAFNFTYKNKLTLINIILYLYTFSQHTHTRVHYTIQSTDRLTDHQYRQRHMYVCVLVGWWSSPPYQAGKRHPKTEKAN